MQETDKIQIGIPIPDAPWRREWIWAEPVLVDDGRTVYRLLNSSIFGPYVVEDLVTVRRSGRNLMLTGLFERGALTGHLVQFSADMPPGAVTALVDEWAASGAVVEGLSGPYYSVATNDEARQRPTAMELARLANEGAIVAFELITDPENPAPPANGRRPA